MSSMMSDGLAAAIQGAGQSGPPPELLAALQQATQGQDPASGPGDPAGGPYGPDQGGGKPGIDDPVFAMLVQKLAQIAADEPDHVDSAALLKLVGELKRLIGGRQDATMTAMGGNPKQMRTMAHAYGG